MTSGKGIETKKYFSNTFFIGLLSFFGGISQDIFLPMLPLYLANVIGLDKSFIGLTEGLVTSSASFFKIIAGFISDKVRRYKPIVFIGYFLSFVSRPLLALVASAGGVLALRFLDGVGKGVKDTPKDALIAASTVEGSRGKGFGIVRALDTLGSVVGPLLLFALLYFLKNNELKYHYIFLIAAVPLIVTLLILALFVHDVPYHKKSQGKVLNLALPRRFYYFLGILILFSLGNSSDTFLILRAQNVGVGLLAIPLVYALFNAVYAGASIPLGGLSDKIGRMPVIIAGWLAYAVAYLGFARVESSGMVWLLFAFYGLYYATTEGVAKAYVADLVGEGMRGRAYGIYNAVLGAVTLPASFMAGLLWDRINPSAPFYFGSVCALVAAVSLYFFHRGGNSRRE